MRIYDRRSTLSGFSRAASFEIFTNFIVHISRARLRGFRESIVVSTASLQNKVAPRLNKCGPNRARCTTTEESRWRH